MTVAFAYTYGRGNPYTSLLSGALEGIGVVVRDFEATDLIGRRLDVLHLHWPESALKGGLASACRGMLKLLTIIWIARLTGTAVVWTVHNLGNHEPRRPRLEALVMRMLARGVDAWIALSPEAGEMVRAELPALDGDRAHVIPHGHYRDAYVRPSGRVDARRGLGLPLDAKVVLFFGQVRRYKNVPSLVDAVRGSGDVDLRLVIAGEFKEGRALLEEARAIDDRVILLPGHLPDSEIPTVFGAADLCVLPFERILNSGSAVLALSMETPILVPASAPFHDLSRMAGDGWVRTFEGELTPSDLIGALDVPAPTIPPSLDYMAWDRVASLTRSAYQSAVARSTGSR